MQSVKWYVERLKSMSASEVVWRLTSLGRDALDRVRIPAGMYPKREALSVGAWSTGFSVTPTSKGAVPEDMRNGERWVEHLTGRAELLLEHRFTFFRFEAEPFGKVINWHRDYNQGLSAPVSFAPMIDYRNAEVAGDCKLVWEPNRHQHLVVLARAYHVTGDERYAGEVVAQLLSWLEQNPFGYGMNWRSPMEQGIRLINWVWALDLIEGADALTDDVRDEIRYSLYLHCWDTQRKYSQGSSANNHLIGEVAGVFIAAAYCKGMPNADTWYAEAKQLLAREIVAQTYDSGCSREHTFGYPYFVIQFFLLSGLVARRVNDDFSESYWVRLEKMMEFMGRLVEGGEFVPMIGDADDGYVLDLDDGQRDYRRILAVGAVLFKRSDFKSWSGSFSEGAWWLLGDEGRAQYDALKDASDSLLTSIAFTDAGYYLLQCGRADERISVLFDCAELGYGAIAAHGHADALSVVVRAYGADVLVDPGTYDYYTYPQWRDYFRSTRAHNTVAVDGADQSEMQGRFLWGSRANSTLLDWQATEFNSLVVGEHDGYCRLDEPVVHRRSVALDHRERTIVITDELVGKGAHDVSIHFHFGETCEMDKDALAAGHCLISFGDHSVEMVFDEALSLEAVKGAESPIGGWLSRGYHRKVPTLMVVGRGKILGNAKFVTTMKFAA